eukprot:4821191-Ditylum_brightwellii.AAC.1
MVDSFEHKVSCSWWILLAQWVENLKGLTGSDRFVIKIQISNWDYSTLAAIVGTDGIQKKIKM